MAGKGLLFKARDAEGEADFPFRGVDTAKESGPYLLVGKRKGEQQLLHAEALPEPEGTFHGLAELFLRRDLPEQRVVEAMAPEGESLPQEMANILFLEVYGVIPQVCVKVDAQEGGHLPCHLPAGIVDGQELFPQGGGQNPFTGEEGGGLFAGSFARGVQTADQHGYPEAKKEVPLADETRVEEEGGGDSPFLEQGSDDGSGFLESVVEGEVKGGPGGGPAAGGDLFEGGGIDGFKVAAEPIEVVAEGAGIPGFQDMAEVWGRVVAHGMVKGKDHLLA